MIKFSPENTKLYFLPVSFIFLLGFSGCYYDVSEELYPANACDTTQISFAGDIYPVIQQKCLSCHSQSMNQGNVNLEGYTQVKTYADNGKLVGSISYASGYSAMPQGEGQLSACTINKMKAWINNGSPEN